MLHLRAHVLDHHVRALHEPLEHLVAGLRLQVELNRPLVPVQILEIRAVPSAHDVLAGRDRRLDANHVGAPVRKMPHARRARARQGEIEDKDVRKRQVG